MISKLLFPKYRKGPLLNQKAIMKPNHNTFINHNLPVKEKYNRSLVTGFKKNKVMETREKPKGKK